LALLAAGSGGARAPVAAPPVVARGAAAGTAASSLIAATLSDDVDVVLFPRERRPRPRPEVSVVTRVRAPAEAIGAVLLDPARYHEALPPLLRADVVARRPGSGAFGPERQIAWELEFPFFNLKGKAWLSRQADMIELALVEGAFAPGVLRVRLVQAADRRATVMTSAVQIEPRSANWIIRRIVGHDPWAETAMTAAAAWVLTRAVALLAEAGPGRAPSRPAAPMAPPAVGRLDGAALAGTGELLQRGAGVVAAVRRAPSGRLAWISAAVSMRGAPAEVEPRLAMPETWGAFPGWKSVTRAKPDPGAPAGQIDFEVTDDVAFVDLDAIWRMPAGQPAHAKAVEGAIAGAVLRWQAFPGSTATTTTAVLSQHPRLDVAGFIEKRMIATEPLLEHALALALTYADAVAIAATLD
jgi:hypothetical protein